MVVEKNNKSENSKQEEKVHRFVLLLNLHSNSEDNYLLPSYIQLNSTFFHSSPDTRKHF